MKKEGIKPIIGSEFYISPDSRFNKKDHYKQGDDTNYHLVLLAENNDGLQNLYKLSKLIIYYFLFWDTIFLYL